ncbi:MAG: enoyl-CoA hydratase/isomerase family protein [Candidatus Limnocylindria bacterium]
MSEDIRYEVEDGIGWLTFDRPEARNAMTFGMYERLAEVSRAVNDDRAVRALVLTGAGEAFVAGTDISQFRDFAEERHAIEYEARMDGVLGALEAVRVPTIAAIGGATVGGGLAIAASCDLRIGSPQATFGMPIARTLGNCLSLANLVRLASLIGAARAKELIFTARLLDAAEALAIGLLHEVTADADSLRPRTAELARRVASHAPLTLWATKEGLRRVRARLLPDEGRDLVLSCYLSRDFKEGVEAFLAKRRPEWRGE